MEDGFAFDLQPKKRDEVSGDGGVEVNGK